MTEDRENTQLVLLRILGVLLIAVGFTMLVQQVRSETALPALAQTIISGDSHRAVQCERRVVEIRKIRLPEVPPIPHVTLTPPVPPAPPAPPVLSL